MLLNLHDFRLGADANQLAAVAISRLQGELAKDGREPKRLRDKSFSGKITIDRSAERSRGKPFSPFHHYSIWHLATTEK